jgi:uncharacterized membrane protein
MSVSERRRARHVSAVRSVVIERPMEQTLELVRDIELLEPLERKARSVEVHPQGPGHGWYRIHGRLASIVPWTGDFSFTHSDCGWHSADLHPREDGWRISGGFVVTPIDEHSCRVTHYEDYGVPDHLRWLYRPLIAYMRLSQVGEMRDLKRLVESRLSRPRTVGSTV